MEGFPSKLRNSVCVQEIQSSVCVLLVITVMVFPAVTSLAGQGLGRVLSTHIEPPLERVARVTACLVLRVHTVTAQVWEKHSISQSSPRAPCITFTSERAYGSTKAHLCSIVHFIVQTPRQEW